MRKNNMTKTLTLNEIVAVLASENRIKTVEKYIGKTPFDEQYIDETINYYAQDQPEIAAEVAEKSGRLEQAVLLYTDAFHQAKGRFGIFDVCYDKYFAEHKLRLAHKACLEQEVETWAKNLLESYEFNKDSDFYSQAITLAEQEPSLAHHLPRLKNAQREAKISHFNSLKRNDDRNYKTFHLAKELELHDEVINLYSKMNNLSAAAEYAEKNGLLDRALDLYIKGKAYEPAFTLAKNTGNIEQANTLLRQWIKELVRKGNDSQAAEVAENNGLYYMAVDLYADCKRYYSALRNARLAGLNDRIPELYIQAQKYYTQLPKHQLADASERFADIASEFGGEEGKQQARQLYEQALQKQISKGISSCSCCVPHLEDAVRIAKKLGLEEKANALMQLYEILKKDVN